MKKHTLDDVRIEKMENGYLVTVSYQPEDSDDNWKNKKYIFPSLDDALEKTKDILETE